jgi:hypothetical protein
MEIESYFFKEGHGSVNVDLKVFVCFLTFLENVSGSL